MTTKLKILQNYLQYSKRIAIFGIAQWAVLALLAFLLAALSICIDTIAYESISTIINNVITCSSTLAIAISGGYYAHSAYDNALKNKADETVQQNG